MAQQNTYDDVQPADGDAFLIRDASDTTQNAAGSTKEATGAQVVTWLKDDHDLGTIPNIGALSDETTALTTGTAKLTWRAPFAGTITDVRASCSTAPVGSTITVDINKNGSTILSTKLTIDASEKTSETAATAAVISDTAVSDDDEFTFDIDQVGSSTAGAGLKVTVYIKRS